MAWRPPPPSYPARDMFRAMWHTFFALMTALALTVAAAVFSLDDPGGKASLPPAGAKDFTTSG